MRAPKGFIPSSYRPILARGDLRISLAGFAISDLGDAMSGLAIAWLAIELADGAHVGVLVGGAIAAYTFPGIIGAGVLGRWMRRIPAPRLLALDCVIRAGLLGTIPIAWAAGILGPTLYLLLLGLSSVTHAWGEAGKLTWVTELIPDDQRLATMALVNTVASSVGLVGPALSGLLITVAGPEWIIALDAVSFGMLAVLVLALSRGDGRGWHVAASAGQVGGRRALRDHPELVAMIVLTWWFSFLYGPTTVALPIYVRDVLGSGAALLGAYGTLFGIGAVVGSLIAGTLRKVSVWPAVIMLIFLWGVAVLPFTIAAPVIVTLIARALGGAIWAPVPTLTLTLFQARTPPDLLSSVLAARRAIGLTAVPLGAALGGPLLDAVGPRTTFLASSLSTVVLAGVAAVGWLWLRRSRRVEEDLDGALRTAD